MFALIDCNSFYCSCERVFRPDLQNKPVVVLSNNDGCIVALTKECKQLGIKRGTPFFKIQEQVRQHNIAVFSSNYALYADMSRRVMEILSRYAPSIEVYSIDESFLDFAGMSLYDLPDYCRNIAHTVTQSTSIPVCVGVGSSKTLAKLANYFAKHYPGYKSVCIIDTDAKRDKALHLAPISEIWGIGRRYAARLTASGIRTAADFVALPVATIRKNMGIVGERLWRELHGESCLSLESIQPDKKQICTSRSFSIMLSEFDSLAAAISELASLSASKLRRQRSVASALMVFISTNYFRKDLPQYSNHTLVKLPVPTSSTIDIVRSAVCGLRSIFYKDFQYKRAGVILTDISRAGAIQGNLFHPTNQAKHNRLMTAVDSVNTRFGRVLELAAVGRSDTTAAFDAADTTSHAIRRDHLSPCYTTRFSDLFIVRNE